ncbi:MAG: metallopeptidase family protein [Pseudomonadota bacterium]
MSTEKAAKVWARAAAPDLALFEAIAKAAYAALPDQFRALSDALPIRIEELPSDDVIRDMGLESPFDLLGLYQGADIGRFRTDYLADGTPDMVFLYRRPILDVWAEGEETLGKLIAHVLVHEIGHHFGLSDADMDAIEARADLDSV